MKKIRIATALFGLTLLFPMVASAQPHSPSPGQIANPYFWIMLAVIILLLVIIISLNHSIALVTEYHRTKKKNGGQAVKSLLLLLAGVTAFSASAQETSLPVVIKDPVVNPFSGMIFGMEPTMFYALTVLILIELIFITVQVRILRSMLPREEKQLKPIRENNVFAFFERFNRSVAIEKEEDIMMGHEYDGIRELDNNLPPWWLYGFYITIIWSVVYLIHFHITGSGALQEEEYRQEMVQAQTEIDAYLARSANNIDENSFKVLTDNDVLKSGEGIYQMNCVSCHGPLGEGKVGPNLTDKFWLHGGSAKEVFSSIKYGWIEKGMKPWKNDLTPTEISKVTSFIFSLQGTNPQGAKEPEGTLFEEKPADSTAVSRTDSLQAN